MLEDMENPNKNEQENQIDFLFSKSFLDSFLRDKVITQDEYDKCIKDLEMVYLTDAGRI